MRPQDSGSQAQAEREIRSLLIGISSIFVALLVSGLALGLYFKRDASTGALVDQPPPVAVAPVESRRDADSLREAAASRVSALAARAPGPRFGVRVGIYAVPDNADRMERRLRTAGFDPLVVLINPDGRELRYVYAGAFANESDALALSEAVEARGMDVWIEVVVGDQPET